MFCNHEILTLSHSFSPCRVLDPPFADDIAHVAGIGLVPISTLLQNYLENALAPPLHVQAPANNEFIMDVVMVLSPTDPLIPTARAFYIPVGCPHVLYVSGIYLHPGVLPSLHAQLAITTTWSLIDSTMRKLDSHVDGNLLILVTLCIRQPKVFDNIMFTATSTGDASHCC